MLLTCFSHVWLCNPRNCSIPGSSVYGILQARMPESVVISYFRSSWPRGRTCVSYINRKISHLALTLDMIQNHNVIMTMPISNLLLESEPTCKSPCSESQSPGEWGHFWILPSVFGTEAGSLNCLLNIYWVPPICQVQLRTWNTQVNMP